MKSIKKLTIFTIAVIGFFMLFCDGVMAKHCTYGSYYRGTWYEDLMIDIQDWNDFNFSSNSIIFENEVSPEKVERNLYKGTELTSTIAIRGAWIFEREVRETVGYSYLFNLFPNETPYGLYREMDMCPPRLLICYYMESRGAFDQLGHMISSLFGSTEPDHYLQILVFRDALTGAEDYSTSDSFWNRIGIGKVTGYECYGVNLVDIKDERYYNSPGEVPCGTYEDYLWGLRVSLGRGEPSCDDNPEFLKYYTDLNDICQRYRESASYTTSDNAARTCMTACSMLRDDIKNICAYNSSPSETQVCRSIGQKVIAWIFKIIGIVKFAVPALLILLGILDFIKAIASDSEDEIKKAGTRFVKRLIAAALIFIIPLILQFVLGLFSLPGLDPNNPFCIL